jgi:hypothetical protein
MPKSSALGSLLALLVAVTGGAIPACAQGAPAGNPPLAIKTFELPPITLQQSYRFQIEATGGVPPLHWSIAKGKLPQGIYLDPSTGLLVGVPMEAGEFHMTVMVTDSARPSQSVSKDFSLGAPAPLQLEWIQPPAVNEHRISGAVKVSNSSKDDFDLTVFIVAVSQNGRANALGYQRINLKKGTSDFAVAFGSDVPRGWYVVHVDAVAEIPAKNAIYRRRLQTEAPLQVAAGP